MDKERNTGLEPTDQDIESTPETRPCPTCGQEVGEIALRAADISPSTTSPSRKRKRGELLDEFGLGEDDIPGVT